MPDEFEWQTDVETEWDELAPAESGPARVAGRRLRIFVLIALVCILAGGALWVYITLNRRVEVATGTAESDLLVTHELLTNAALRGDFDVVESLLSKRPSSWRALQTQLIGRRLFFSRHPLGIDVDRDTDAQVALVGSVRLTPDLNWAEIADRRPYIIRAGQGSTETVTLERTFLYKRTDNQWLLAAPEDERAFWGNWVNDERDYLTTIYPSRDEAVAIRLSAYLDDMLAELCANQAVNCPADFHLEFKLETDPASIRRLGDGLYPIVAGAAAQSNRLVLPAPGLVGAPVDEAGYQALRRGYAGWIGAAVVAQYGQQDAGSDAVATAGVLAEFDLLPPPDPIQPLPRPSLASFPPGAPAPRQDILMICGGQSSLRLLRFNTASGRWHEEVPADAWPQPPRPSNGAGYYLTRLSDYQGALVQSVTYEIGGDGQELWRSYLWQDGVMRLITEDPSVHYYLPPSLQPPNQPEERYLAFYVPGEANGQQGFSAALIDMKGCQDDPCDLQPLSGLPVWSPDGRRTLIITAEADGANTLHLGDEEGNVVELIGRGQSPVWLDDERFTYVALEPGLARDQMGRRFGQEVILATITDGQDGVILAYEPLFDAGQVRQTIAETNRPDELALWSAQPALKGESWWFVGASAAGDSESQDFISIFNAHSGEARLSADLGPYRLIQTPMVSPQGGYAVVAGLSPDGSEVSIELLDATTGELRRLDGYFPTDWSSDDQWLIQMGRGPLVLMAAATGQEWNIEYDLPGCNTAVWTVR